MTKLFNPPSVMEVTPYKIVGALNETITKARLKVFYLGENDNGSFITKEFGERLMQTIPYCPTKGIYDRGSRDFMGHAEPDDGRIYGVVPEDPNLTWEDIRDEDGILRTYGCVDVYLYTGLYKEAREIIGKSQSMELLPESIVGEWTVRDGFPVYTYTDASFLGLQVLGEDHTPCFPDSNFFTKENSRGMDDSIAYLFTKITEMEKTMLKDKDRDKDKDEVNIEVETSVELEVEAVTAEFEAEVEATEVEATEVEATEFEVEVEAGCEIQPEATETVESEVEVVEAETVEVDYESRILELTDLTSTLQTEKEALTNLMAEMETELSTLREFQKGIERKDKEVVISKYETRLENSIIEGIREKIDEFSVEDLAKELAFHLVETNAEFTLSNTSYTLADNSTDAVNGLESYLLSRRNKK